MMKLYSGDLSPYSARVRMQIYAKGITGITLERPANFGMPEYREQHPIGRVPVLILENGDAIPESGVIAEYLEEVYPEPSLLGTTPRENALIRTIEHIGDIYLMNNLFMLAGQTRATERNQGLVDLLVGQVVRNVKALDKMISRDGFACCGRITLADCALLPALFMIGYILPALDVADPLARNANVAAYWVAIQKNEHAAKVLAELRRGLEERLEMIRSGEFAKRMAAMAAAHAAAEAASNG